MALPPLDSLTQTAALTECLSTLFEPSESLKNELVPSVQARLTTPPASYHDLIATCAAATNGWDYARKADFVSGHPLIGEVGNLSALSTKEQLSKATAPVVLARLAHLNDLYTTVYPGLRYITFVNGRSRAVIVNELERAIGIAPSPSPLPDDFFTSSPAKDSAAIAALVRPADSDAWKNECDRAIADVWEIALARVKGLGLD